MNEPPDQATKLRATKNAYSVTKRFLKYLLLRIALAIYFFYLLIRKHASTQKIIVFIFIIANLMLIDLVLWRYFQGKNKGIIFIIELFISSLVLLWII